MQTPQDYGLPHDDFYPNQLETINWLEEQSGITLLESMTGSGKTGMITALGYDTTATAIVKTKNLQTVNYGQLYDWHTLFGRGNYPCIHPNGRGLTSLECPANKNGGMRSCWYYSECPYIQAKQTAMQSPKLAVNYALWMTAKWLREEPPRVLVLDEGDELPDIVVQYASCEIGLKQKREWSLPDFPSIGSAMPIGGPSAVDLALEWLEKSLEIIRIEYKKLKNARTDWELIKLRQCERIGLNLRHTKDALFISPHDWYIRSNFASFFAKPLTARYHWPHFFNVSEQVVIMSATIGKTPDPLTAELGIQDYAYKSVPSAYPAEDRPIWIPEGAPRIGAKAKPSAYELQADLAVKAIKDCPGDWYGIILVTSKVEAKRVAKRMAKRGLEDRIFCAPEIGTDKQTAKWQEEKLKRPGALMITWNHWRGYDGLDERILICLKTPFGRRGQPGSYEYEHMKYGGSLYQWRTANLLAQGCGRTRRTPEDYHPDAGRVAVIDGNWRMVKKYLPESFLESVIH